MLSQRVSIELSELDWVHVNNIVSLNDVSVRRLHWDSLGNWLLLAGLLSINLEFIVGLDSLDESKSGS